MAQGSYTKKILFSFALILFPLTAFGVTQPTYRMLGVGTSDAQYRPYTQNQIDALLDEVPNAGMQSLQFEMGLYWPANRFMTIHGATAGYFMDSPVYSVQKPTKQTTITQYALAYSAMRFFTRDIGAGPFLRADIGAVSRGVLFRDNDLDQTTTYQERGLLLLGAVGYGLRLSYRTRGLVSLSYSLMGNTNEQSRFLTFSLHVFW